MVASLILTFVIFVFLVVAMSTLKAWRQVTNPHADIRLGKFDSSVFAADLGEVLAGRGAADYREAGTFYSKTYLTDGISRLLIEVMQRLSGTGKTDPVIQLQTPFGGGQQRGATLPQIRLAVLNPEMAPPFISDALDRMTKRLWFMYQDSGLYRFDSRPNLNRILVDREELVRSEPEKVRDFAKATLNDLIGDATFRVFRYPEAGDDNFVADEPRLGLVVLDLDQPATEDGLPKETEEFVTRILKQHGKGFRKHANMLVFLAPDQQRSSEIIDAARRLLALRSIDDDKTTKKQLSEEQLRDLADRLKDAQARLPGALTTAYRHILVPAEKKTVKCLDMGISSYTGRTTLSSKVLEKLIDEGSLLDKLDPDFLVPTSALGKRFGLWPEDQEVINVRTLAEFFTQLTHLPRLHGSQVLPDCFAKGVQRGLFAYALGDGEKKIFDTIFFGDKTISGDRCEITESAWLLRPDLAKSLMLKQETLAVGTTGGTTEVTGGGESGQDEGRKGGRAGEDCEGRTPSQQGSSEPEIGSLGELERHLQRGH